MRNAVLVYNPAAGRFPSWILAERAADYFRRHDWQVRLEPSRDGEHITALARQAAEEGQDALLVVGGDGSINQAVSGLMGSETALGVLPAGTANVWAQELGLPTLNWTRWMALEEAAHRLVDAPVRSVDLGLLNDRPFLLWGGIGLDAFIVHRLEPRTRWEKHFAVVQYTASAIWNAGFWRGMNLEVVVDGQSIRGHFLLAVLSNIHLYAGGYAELAADARLDDGWMDLWLCRGETLGDTVQFAWDLLSGNHHQSERIERIPFQELQFASVSPMYVQVDGEPVQTNGPVTVRVLPKALKVLAPLETPHRLFLETEPVRGAG